MTMHKAMLLSKRLRQRLLSVGEQTNHGYMFVFKEDKAHIFHNNILVKTVDKENNLYPMRINRPGASKRQLQSDREEAHALVDFIDKMEIVEITEQAKATEQSSRTFSGTTNATRSESSSFTNAQNNVSTANIVIIYSERFDGRETKPKTYRYCIGVVYQFVHRKSLPIMNFKLNTLGVPSHAINIAGDISSVEQDLRAIGFASHAISTNVIQPCGNSGIRKQSSSEFLSAEWDDATKVRHLDFAISTSSPDDDISELQERRAALADAITETRRIHEE
jgi:hypothetical protein